MVESSTEISDFEIDKTKFIPLNEHTLLKYKNTNFISPIYIFDIEDLCPPNYNPTHLRKEHIYLSLIDQGMSKENAKKHLFLLANKQTQKLNSFEQQKFFLKEDFDLKKNLLDLNGTKFCLTNETLLHSKELIHKLGLSSIFQAVFYCDYKNIDFIAKPDSIVFNLVSYVLNVKNDDVVYFFDKNIQNINSAKKVGWKGILISGKELKDVLEEFQFK